MGSPAHSLDAPPTTTGSGRMTALAITLVLILAAAFTYGRFKHDQRQRQRAAERFSAALHRDECDGWAAFHNPSSDIPGAK